MGKIQQFILLDLEILQFLREQRHSKSKHGEAVDPEELMLELVEEEDLMQDQLLPDHSQLLILIQ